MNPISDARSALEGFIIPNGKTAVTLVDQLREHMTATYVTKWLRLKQEFDREPPFDPQKLKENNQSYRVNVNIGEMESLISEATAAATETVFSPGKFIEPELLTTLPNAGASGDTYSRVLASEYSDMLNDGICPFTFVGDVHQETMLYGISATIFPDEYDWKPRHYEVDRFLFPDKCPTEPKDIPLFAIVRGIPVHELFSLVSKTPGAWNLELVRRVLLDHFEKGAQSASTSSLQERFGLLSARYDRGDADLRAETLSEVPVVDLFAADPSTGKVTHLILWEGAPDAESGDTARSMADKEVEGIASILEEGHVLFVRRDRFPSMDRALWLMTYDSGSGDLDSVKGLGSRVYTHCTTSNRLFCQTLDGAVQSASLVLVPPEAGAESKIPFSRVGPYTALAPGWSIPSSNFNPPINHLITLRSMSASIMHNNVGNYRRRSENPNSRDGDKSARQVAAEENQETEVEQGRSMYRFQAWDRLHTEIFRRATNPDLLLVGFPGTKKKDKVTSFAKWVRERLSNSHPEDEDFLDTLPGGDRPGRHAAIRFVARCELRGLPIELLLLGRWRILAARGVGTASRGSRVQALQGLLALRSEMPPDRRRSVIREYASQLTSNARLAERVFPDLEGGQFVSQTISLVTIENSMFQLDRTLPVADDQPHREHLEGHMRGLMEAAQQWRTNPSRESLVPLAAFFRHGIPHCETHLQLFSRDPFAKDDLPAWTEQVARITAMGREFLRMAAQVVEEQAQERQRLLDENAKLQEEVTNGNVELKARIHQINMEHQVEMRKAESLHESRMAKLQTSIEAMVRRMESDEGRATQKHYLELQREFEDMQVKRQKDQLAIQQLQAQVAAQQKNQGSGPPQ